jgi:hypothetical protein
MNHMYMVQLELTLLWTNYGLHTIMYGQGADKQGPWLYGVRKDLGNLYHLSNYSYPTFYLSKPNSTKENKGAFTLGVKDSSIKSLNTKLVI